MNGPVPIEFIITSPGDTFFFRVLIFGVFVFCFSYSVFFKAQFLKSDYLMYILNAFISLLLLSMCLSSILICKQSNYLPIRYDLSSTKKTKKQKKSLYS